MCSNSPSCRRHICYTQSSFSADDVYARLVQLDIHRRHRHVCAVDNQTSSYKYERMITKLSPYLDNHDNKHSCYTYSRRGGNASYCLRKRLTENQNINQLLVLDMQLLYRLLQLHQHQSSHHVTAYYIFIRDLVLDTFSSLRFIILLS